MKNPYTHKVITLTGPDCVGKTTQVALLQKAINPSTTLKFPNTGCWSEKVIRAALSSERIIVEKEPEYSGTIHPKFFSANADPIAFQYLQAINRRTFQHYIKSALTHAHVIMDRYDADVILYGYASGVPLDLCMKMMEQDIESDLVIVMYGAGFFGGNNRGMDNNDKDTKLQNKVRKNGEAMAALYPDKYIMLNVDEYNQYNSTGGSITSSIWSIHKRLCGKVAQYLGIQTTPLEYVAVEGALKEGRRT